MKIKSVFGAVLGSLVVSSAVLAVAGIWDVISGDTVWQIEATFFVVAGATIGLSYVTSAFFNNK